MATSSSLIVATSVPDGTVTAAKDFALQWPYLAFVLVVLGGVGFVAIKTSAHIAATVKKLVEIDQRNQDENRELIGKIQKDHREQLAVQSNDYRAALADQATRSESALREIVDARREDERLNREALVKTGSILAEAGAELERFRQFFAHVRERANNG